MKDKKYIIKEIFVSMQGEGLYTGTICWFIRFAGCNIRCEFCDTLWKVDDDCLKMTCDEILEYLENNTKSHIRWVVLTGGEPLLQIDDHLLYKLMHRYDIQIETNGTISNSKLEFLKERHPQCFVSMSPKLRPLETELEHCDQIKVLYPFYRSDKTIDKRMDPSQWDNFDAKHWYIQPYLLNEDFDDHIEAIHATLGRIYTLKKSWNISLQTHKLIGVK